MSPTPRCHKCKRPLIRRATTSELTWGGWCDVCHQKYDQNGESRERYNAGTKGPLYDPLLDEIERTQAEERR